MHDHISPTGPVSQHLRKRGFDVDEIVVVPKQDLHNPNVAFTFPDAAAYDVLIPMGAPWGAWDDGCIGRWLLPEVEWLRHAIGADIPVLGICFGGQLIARALGGTVARAPKAEIGWTPIHSDDPTLVPTGPWFQFHYDRWTVPEGARELARNSAASQAFQHGRSLAVQFHPELTAHGLLGWLNAGGREQVLSDGQDPEVLLTHTLAEEPQAVVRTNALIDSYLERIALL